MGIKLAKKILASIAEGTYNVVVKSFTAKAVEGQQGYIEMELEVDDGPNKGRTGKFNIWPARQDWTFAQLVDKAQLDGIEDTDELVGKTIEMSYTHTYVDKETGEVKNSKSWNLYPNS